ncbi:hypothetical protein P0Y43_16945 [Pseudomonas entomophila]|uniref:hypothetical protein n=1 Tax=Pseudomonas entomophila TaxID=312306 RepID=UPI0023D86CFE|nr:hypothetical protein [Pseudomonas entomophila]MDF0732398.1 hypothetical protein [Pseudomonas entomophila]
MNRTALLTLLAGLLHLPPLLAAPANLGVITVAEKPVQLIRATTLYEASAGTGLKSTDYLETGSAGLLIDQLAGTRVALGPNTRLYLEQAGNTTHLGLLQGWLKLQPLPGVPQGNLRVTTTNLALDASKAASVIHAAASGTEVFVEDGTVSLRDPRQPARDAAKQVLRREEYAQAKGQGPQGSPGRPSGEFIGAMPPAFFDPLPSVARRKAASDPLNKLREVTFADASPLLLGPLKPNGASLATRFSPRLADPAFRQAVVQRFGGTLDWETALYRFERKNAAH